MIDRLAGRDVGVKRHICFMNAGGKCPNCEDEIESNTSKSFPRNDDFWVSGPTGNLIHSLTSLPDAAGIFSTLQLLVEIFFRK